MRLSLRSLDLRALRVAVSIQLVYLLVLLLTQPLRHSHLQSAGLFLAMGIIAGILGGRLAGGSRRRRAVHGCCAGGLGGVWFALLLTLAMYVPFIPYGAFFTPTVIVAGRMPNWAYINGYDPWLALAAGSTMVFIYGAIGGIVAWFDPAPNQPPRVLGE